jgi:ABC-type proline/glycine betaine transport system ATPase subunit
VLTGRENIVINAAVLGMSKAEIGRRFDQIVEFSGLEQFIDMPVQSYSSGMAVRLGFAVAAHLEPDSLLVDEVLAVGDLAFRMKCQARIQELKQDGVAIVLVSHNLHTISHVCTRAITLEHGRVIYDGETEAAIEAYRSSLMTSEAGAGAHSGSGTIRIVAVETLNGAGAQQHDFNMGDALRLRVHYQADEPVDHPVFNLTIQVAGGHQVTGIRTDSDGLQLGTLYGAGYLDIVIDNFNLLPNVYSIDAVIFQRDGFTFYDRINRVAHVKVRGRADIIGTTYLPHTWHNLPHSEIVDPNLLISANGQLHNTP